jgi:DNA-binding response OmpR family regulator
MGAPRILVADDDAWILRMVTTVLEKRGYVVTTASDGEDAYDQAIESPPDLVITDVMMPKMDGWTLAKALRARPEFAFVPIIFLTALGSDDDRIKGFRLGADDYLPKPFRFEELDLRVAKTLRQRTMIQNDLPALAEGSGPQSAPAGLRGSLAQLGLSPLLTVLEMERKSGVLTLTGSDDTAGRIFLRDGRIVGARLDGDALVNEECVFHLLSWTDGQFEFAQVQVDMEDEIRATTTHLLMEGARRLDELQREQPF